MLVRRVLLRSPSPLSSLPSLLPFVRPFSTSLLHRKTPSLADITPNGASTFDARQKEFRDERKAAAKAKAEQDSQSVNASPPLQASPSSFPPSPTSPLSTQGNPRDGIAHASNGETQSPKGGLAGVASDLANNLALGSLSTHSTEAERDAAAQQETTKRKGALSSLIYGTHEGQQMVKEIERSFSQVLARGKYVHSIVFHKVKPDKVDEYVKLVGGWYPKMASLEENHVHLVGSWRTEVGDCDTFGKDTRRKESYLRNELFNGLENGSADITKYTSGSTNVTKGTTPPFIPSPRTPTLPPSTGHSRP